MERKLYFITGNKNKFEEAKHLLPDLEQLEIDLPEIQSDNAQEIVEAKLQEAFKHHAGPFLVEDTSLEFDCLQGLPGPFIKFFLKRLGPAGLFDLVSKYEDHTAIAKTIIGYAKSPEEIEYFVGEVRGEIVSPRGETTFGWDPVFLPDGYKETYAEMSKKEKAKMSHRAKAFQKLLAYLQK